MYILSYVLNFNEVLHFRSQTWSKQHQPPNKIGPWSACPHHQSSRRCCRASSPLSSAAPRGPPQRRILGGVTPRDPKGDPRKSQQNDDAERKTGPQPSETFRNADAICFKKIMAFRWPTASASPHLARQDLVKDIAVAGQSNARVGLAVLAEGRTFPWKTRGKKQRKNLPEILDFMMSNDFHYFPGRK